MKNGLSVEDEVVVASLAVGIGWLSSTASDEPWCVSVVVHWPASSELELMLGFVAFEAKSV